MARFSVVLDACVLVPVVLADTLLRVAERGVFRPLWSERILGEAMDAICEVHPTIDTELVTRRLLAMATTVEDATIAGWEPLEQDVVLPDPNDRHVVAVALRAGAQAIVASNVRDFPESALKAFGLEAIHPDEFLLDELELAPKVVLEVLAGQAAHTTRPPLTPSDLLVRLARAGVPGFADEVARLL